MSFDEHFKTEKSIDALIETLLLAKKVGFQSQSLPTDVLLEIAVDLSISLRDAYLQERPWRQLNKELIFDYRFSDETNNPYSYWRHYKSKIARDSWGKDFFGALTNFFIYLKRTNDLETSFMNAFKTFFPEKIVKEVQKIQRSKESSKARFYYHRRKKLS
jgi:hypothetical protein